MSWYSFASEMSGVKYSASFSRDGGLRAEIYIDTGDKAENKAIFDRLLTDRASIERDFGTALEWERLDDRRASRVAIYTKGSIGDDEQQLASHRGWFITNLLRFRKVFGPRLEAMAT